MSRNRIDHSNGDSAALTAAAPMEADDGGNAGIGVLSRSLSHYDSLPDLLRQWMVAAGYQPGGGNQAFLTHLGLQGVTPEQWQALLDGKAAPGKRLMNTLCCLLPGVFFGDPNPDFFVLPQDLRRYVATKTGRMQGEQVELSAADAAAMRRELLARLAGRPPAGPVQADIAVNEAMLAQMANDMGLADSPAAARKRIAVALRDRPELLQLLREHEPDLTPLRSGGAGAMLCLLRQLGGLSQEALAGKLGLGRQTIRHWEHGKQPVNPGALPALHTYLGLGVEEAARFVPMVNPAITADDVTGWLRRKPPATEFLSFPSFDDQWLERQPEAKRAGLLLHDYRERAGLMQKELAGKLGQAQSIISSWERGEKPIPDGSKQREKRIDRVPDIIRALLSVQGASAWFNGAEQQRFCNTVGLSNRHAKRKRVEMLVESVNPGVTMPLADAPPEVRDGLAGPGLHHGG